MTRAVIYCRVSTKEQTENLSLPTQKKACVDYCERENLDVEAVFIEEGESAKTTNRPKFRELLAYCRAHRDRVDYVVVYRVDRFARDAADHHAVRTILLRDEIQLRSVTEPIGETTEGRLMENILASFAQFDNDVRSDRTKAGMQTALRRGQWTFQAPLGYITPPAAMGGSSLVPDPTRAPILREAFELMADRQISKAEVLRWMNNRGLRTRHGNPVSAQTVDRVLHNRIYCGWISIPSWGIETKGDFEAIVNQDTFDRVQGVLAGNRAPTTKHLLDHPDFPLRRFVRCGACGRPLTGSWSTGRAGRKYGYYSCPNTACRHVSVRKLEMEMAFVESLDALAVERPVAKLFSVIVSDVYREKRAGAGTRTDELEKELAEVQEHKSRLVDAFVCRQVIDAKTYQEQLDRLNVKLGRIQLGLGEAHPVEIPDLDRVLIRAQEVVTDPAGTWKSLSLDPKLRFQRLVFPEGLTFDGGAIGTAVTSPIFGVLQAVAAGSDDVASPTGFEPEGQSAEGISDNLD